MPGRTLLRPVLDRHGVALPLALLGLVAMTLLVTTMMMTTSTEAAVSSAGAGAAQSLYDAESGLQAYIAQNQAVALTPLTTDFTIPGTGRQTRIVVTQLMERLNADNSSMTVTAITSTPLRTNPTRLSGRPVVSMVTQTFPPPINLNIKSSVTMGGDLDVQGNAFTVNGASTACGNGSAGVQAVTGATGSQVSANGNGISNFTGVDSLGHATTGNAAIAQSGLSKQQLELMALGGKTLPQLIAALPARDKYGPAYAVNGVTRTFPGTVGPPSTPDSVAVVDANGGTVSLLGGGGMLIITNGNLSMQGNATFNGIILVDGNFELGGTPRVNGAIISLSVTGQNRIALTDGGDNSDIHGNVTVQFNRCMTNAAQRAFTNAATGNPTTTTQSYGWFEVVR
ncbi:MAG TPA: hypothetical protein VFE05_13200 [Longimicrobiaceae bacterium]|jgi:hypothetical protein|nr:hypothetical protein [Longimicrobiaceae bacterium]